MSETRRIVFDLDGTLCSQEKYGDYHFARPIQRVIDKCNELFDAGWDVTIFTARGMVTHAGDVQAVEIALRALTADWLNHYGVHCTRLLFGKPPADIYVDDKCLLPQELTGEAYES